MEATPKHPTLDALLSSFAGKDRQLTIRKGLCMTCDRKTSALFRDDLSRKEYAISGMCQECQDDFFGRGVPSDE